MELTHRFFKIPTHSFFLFGPRGTGKSTWLRHNCPNALTVDLLKPDVFRNFAGKPERLSQLIAAQKNLHQVVIDEVQKIPALLSVVHGLIEENKDLQFVLTGSSARKIKREGVDLLAGRALNMAMHPFMASELGPSFDMEKALKIGLVPLVVSSPQAKEVLKSYVALYINEEVKMEGLVRKIGGFSRFLEAVSFSHAAMLNVATVARECEVERNTVKGFLDVLEDLLLSFTLPPFSKRAKRRLVKHDKFYLFDAGVFRSLRPKGPLDRPSEIDGAALEGLVAQHLRAWNDYRGKPNQLYFWRTSNGVEVDFVVYGPEGIWAIEVKNASKIHSTDLRHLKSFHKDYPESRCLLLYRGQEKLRMGPVLCLPCQEFLLSLSPDKALTF